MSIIVKQQAKPKTPVKVKVNVQPQIKAEVATAPTGAATVVETIYQLDDGYF